MLHTRTRLAALTALVLLAGCRDLAPDADATAVPDTAVAPPGEWRTDDAGGPPAPAAASTPAAPVPGAASRTALPDSALVAAGSVNTASISALLDDPAQWDAQVASWQSRFATDATTQHRRQEHLDALKQRLQQGSPSAQLQGLDCSPQLCLVAVTVLPGEVAALEAVLATPGTGQPPIYTSTALRKVGSASAEGAALYRAVIGVDPAVRAVSGQVR
ncbi:hypothetical protein [Stenotrophomonas sp.]|uniref:hypothetical protein n=1 Tax=Stenotrophomonas sp. TaxID=69392 RepID=UPI002FC8D120